MKKWQAAVTAICVALLVYVSAYVALRLASPEKVFSYGDFDNFAIVVDGPYISVPPKIWIPPKPSTLQKIQRFTNSFFTPLQFLDEKLTGQYFLLYSLSTDQFIPRPSP